MVSLNKKLVKSYTGTQVGDRAYNMVIGATVAYGLVMNIFMTWIMPHAFENVDPLLFLIIYFACAIGGVFMVGESDSAFVAFVGYNMLVVPVGAVLTFNFPDYPVEVIIRAFAITAIIVAVMITLAGICPDVFKSMGATLFMALFLGIMGEILSIVLFGYSGTFFDALFIVVFTLYLGYDWVVAQECPKTVHNAVFSAIGIYLDIVNLIIRLLEITGKKKK